MMPESFKEKENNCKELFNKWEEKVIYRKSNWKKSEDSLRAKEEKAHLLKPLSSTFKKKTRDSTTKSKT